MKKRTNKEAKEILSKSTQLSKSKFNPPLRKRTSEEDVTEYQLWASKIRKGIQ